MMGGHRLTRAVLIVVFAALAAALVYIPAGGARSQAANGRIAFGSTRDGDSSSYRIWTMNPNGSAMVDLTPASQNNQQPAWTPDGAKIAYSTNSNPPSSANYAIAYMDANGANKTKVIDTSSPAGGTGKLLNEAPVWSPDGTKLAFDYVTGQPYQIGRVDSTGANFTALTSSATGVGNLFPTWSPDGSKIAFESDRDGDFEIYVMDAATGDTIASPAVQLTSNSSSEEHPAWSPNGTKIAFTSTRDGNYEIYVMDANGSNPQRLTNDGNTPHGDYYPAWSPDGTKIVFSSDRPGTGSTTSDLLLWTINSNDGSGLTQLTFEQPSGQTNDIRPSWGTAPVTAVTNLRSIGARRTAAGATVSWRTAVEVGVAGFDVYRGAARLNRRLVPATHPLGGTYSFLDRKARGVATYRVEIVAASGARSWSKAVVATR